jgi:hypothetical protein
VGRPASAAELGRGQTVVIVVGCHQAEGAVAMLGVVSADGEVCGCLRFLALERKVCITPPINKDHGSGSPCSEARSGNSTP